MAWYSFPLGCGFLGENIHPGHVKLLFHIEIDSYKQDTQFFNDHILRVFIPLTNHMMNFK